MGSPSINNIGQFIHPFACGLSTATAGGTGDATAVTGATIDRQGYSSAKVAVAFKATLASTKTLSIAVEYQDSEDGSTWNTAVALLSTTVVLSATGTSIWTYNLNLAPLARYVRINFTPDLSASGTDTAILSATLALGGAQVLPA